MEVTAPPGSFLSLRLPYVRAVDVICPDPNNCALEASIPLIKAIDPGGRRAKDVDPNRLRAVAGVIEIGEALFGGFVGSQPPLTRMQMPAGPKATDVGSEGVAFYPCSFRIQGLGKPYLDAQYIYRYNPWLRFASY